MAHAMHSSNEIPDDFKAILQDPGHLAFTLGMRPRPQRTLPNTDSVDTTRIDPHEPKTTRIQSERSLKSRPEAAVAAAQQFASDFDILPAHHAKNKRPRLRCKFCGEETAFNAKRQRHHLSTCHKRPQATSVVKKPSVPRNENLSSTKNSAVSISERRASHGAKRKREAVRSESSRTSLSTSPSGIFSAVDRPRFDNDSSSDLTSLASDTEILPDVATVDNRPSKVKASGPKRVRRSVPVTTKVPSKGSENVKAVKPGRILPVPTTEMQHGQRSVRRKVVSATKLPGKFIKGRAKSKAKITPRAPQPAIPHVNPSFALAESYKNYARRVLSSASNSRWPCVSLLPNRQEVAAFNEAESLPLELAEMDTELLELSKRLTAILPIDQKPRPENRPRVWADGRSEMCDSLPYFKGYQSGTSGSNGIINAYLLDGFSQPRDYFDFDHVVSSGAGGGKVRVKDSDEIFQGCDQKFSAYDRYLTNNMALQYPVILILGDRNGMFPARIPNRYCVWDFFKPVSMWTEKIGGRIRQKRLFERLDPIQRNWTAPEDFIDLVKPGSLPAPLKRTCSSCNKESQQIYLQGWICTNEHCAKFWTFKNGAIPNDNNLDYDPRFLKQRTYWANEQVPFDLRPSLMTVDQDALIGEEYSRRAWEGIVCPHCGRCTSRVHFDRWECGNKDCGFIHRLSNRIIPAKSLEDMKQPLTHSPALPNAWVMDHNVKISHQFQGYHRITIYQPFPELDECFIAHLPANRTANEEPGGPNEMWEEIQRVGGSMDLQRRSLANGGTNYHVSDGMHYTDQHTAVEGGGRMNAFSTNYVNTDDLVALGMPYKFIARVASQSFEAAPDAVKHARSRLNWAARQVTHEFPNEFNEVKYHTDDEVGLGPTVASLSLGSAAEMTFRMGEKHYHGITPAGLFWDDLPMTGCLHHDRRTEMFDQLQSEKAEHKYSPGQLRRRLLEMGMQLYPGDYVKGPMKKSSNGMVITRRGSRARQQVDGDGNIADAEDLAVPQKYQITSKKQREVKTRGPEVLKLKLRHGDMMVMHGAAVQKYLEHEVTPCEPGKPRFALTARYIDPATILHEDKPDYEIFPDNGLYDGTGYRHVAQSTILG
ncbi:hypothetical protein LTR50_002998 [Elasticomyces elasticus]|nr:hypothetical protein LTR50_002998 [Elasticomyces elasticus]